MKIKKTDLQEALEIVKPGLANKEVIEQSTSFAFMGSRVVTYNDELSISHPIDGLSIIGAVKADELYKLLSKMKGEELEIESQGTEIIIEQGKIKSGLTLQAEIKLPVDSIGDMGEWTDLPEDFCKHLDFCAQASSHDMSRPVLTCVNIRQDGTFEASDSFRLAVCRGKEMGVPDFLLPATLATEVVKMEPFQIATGDGWVHFRTPKETIISCRIYSEKFPDITKILQVEGEILIFPKTISELIDRASVFSKRAHFLDETIEITIGGKKLKVSSTSDTGWYIEETNMRYDGPEVTFGITPKLFITIFEQVQEAGFSKDRIKFTGDDWVYVGLLRDVPVKKQKI